MTRRLPLVLVALAALVAACGTPPPTRIERLYEGLTDPLPRVDPSILAGRRIVVDPGHGGHFRGTVGQDSLEESMVNLGVGLYLWGLLHEAGANVWLTRSIDRDFLAPGDSSLADDLQARVDMADTLRPDVFVSIHHNAQPRRDPDYNRVETYYKAGDPASLDLAFAVHRHLMRNLGITAGEVRQGNYYVLRKSPGAAVLGESSYLTHPPVEKRLRLSDAQRLEAEAYFLGILDYFSRGIPRISVAAARPDSAARVPTLRYAVVDDGGVGIDPDGVTLEVGGTTVTPVLDDLHTTVTYPLPWDAPNREYDVAMTVRNLLGNTSPVFHDTVVVNLPAKAALFDNVPAFPGGVARVRARLVDERGISVGEGTPVAVTTAAGRDTIHAVVANGRLDVPFVAPAAAGKVAVTLHAGGRAFESSVEVLDPAAAYDRPALGDYRPVRVADARDGAPIPGATIAVDGRPVSVAGGSDGVCFFPQKHGLAEEVEWTVSAPGYIPLVQTGPFVADSVSLTPWLDGVLRGVRFVIDPEGGRARDVGMGKLGLSASAVNLRVAVYLAGFLRAAGAEARLTRTTEAVPTPEDIARMTNRWGAERYIEIRHRAEPDDSALSVKTFYFPGSRTGLRFAADVGETLARRLGVPVRTPADLVTYPLQQTACPAIVVEAPSIGNVDEEMRLDDPWYLREQAYAIFLGIADHFFAPVGSVVEVDCPEGERLVEFAGTWNLLASPSGRARFEFIPRGDYIISVLRGDQALAVPASVDADTVRVPTPAFGR